MISPSMAWLGWASNRPSVTNPYSSNGERRTKANKKSGRWIISFLLILLPGGACAAYWKWAHGLNLNLYQNRIEFLFVSGRRSALNMWSWMLSPLIHPHSAAILWDRFWSGNYGGHPANLEYYDPAKHNNAYRHVELNMMNREECTALRTLALKEMGGTTNDWDEALHMEFQESALRRLLQSEHATDEENNLLFDVLGRVQRQAEKMSNDANIYVDYGSVTLRNNKLPTGWANWAKRWWFSTSSGHGIHADQCRIVVARGRHPKAEGWLGDWLRPSTYSFWNHDFECYLLSSHCCFFRTHTSLLYLNDPEDQDVFGGELYILDRKDVSPDETEPIYSGGPLSKLAENVLMVKPTCGTFVVMASDTRNIHGTMPMTTGKRFALPMWWTSYKGLSNHDLTDDQLDEVELKSRDACTRIDTSQQDNFPPPGGLVQKRGDCDAWLDSQRDPETWEPY